MASKRDYYDILGVSKSAGADDIKSAYRKLARKFHPDVTKNDPKLTEKFKEAQEAYDVLGDATKRQNYDQFGHAGVGAGGAGAAAGGVDPFEAFRRAQQGRAGNGGGRRSWNGGPGVTVEDFEGGGDFGSIFDQLFGGRGGGGGGGRAGRARSTRPPERGRDIEYPVTLSFEQAARGTNLPLQLSGDGKTQTIDIKIPAGVKDGSRVRIRGRGQPSEGEAGDLFIIVSISPHPYFRREGLDVYVDVPVSLYEALLGAKVEVPTLDGKLTLTIPPGTGGGAKLRIKGKGIVRGDEHGDQFAMIKVAMPKPLDEPDKEMIAKLAAKHPMDARKDAPWS
jgi:DnaJ-class molecular chaperone